jgi:hypothetical protein
LSKLEKAEQELASTYDQNLTLQKTNKAAEAQAKTLAAAKEFMQAEFDRILYERNEYQKQSESQYELYMEAKDIEIENIMEKLTKVREEKKATEDELATTKKENEDLLLQLRQATSVTDEKLRNLVRLEVELDCIKSANKTLIEKVIDLKGNKESKIESDLKCAIKDYQKINLLQFVEHKAETDQQNDRFHSQL